MPSCYRSTHLGFQKSDPESPPPMIDAYLEILAASGAAQADGLRAHSLVSSPGYFLLHCIREGHGIDSAGDFGELKIHRLPCLEVHQTPRTNLVKTPLFAPTLV